MVAKTAFAKTSYSEPHACKDLENSKRFPAQQPHERGGGLDLPVKKSKQEPHREEIRSRRSRRDARTKTENVLGLYNENPQAFHECSYTFRVLRIRCGKKKTVAKETLHWRGAYPPPHPPLPPADKLKWSFSGLKCILSCQRFFFNGASQVHRWA